jgi:hypothetical protein
LRWSDEHKKWIKETGLILHTACGKEVPVLEFEYDTSDNDCLLAWARHFRNHYCDDAEIDELRAGTGLSRKDFLEVLKFPAKLIEDPQDTTGPATRSGDFSEILIADYLEYILNFWVPRTRYEFKVNKNTSEQGSDVLGFKFVGEGSSSRDELLIFEVKGTLTGNKKVSRLQDAADHSDKDKARLGVSLNAVKQRLRYKGHSEEALKVGRFQNLADNPYNQRFGAAAVLSNSAYDEATLATTNSSNNANYESLSMLVIRGEDLMALVHMLYETAANEA